MVLIVLNFTYNVDQWIQECLKWAAPSKQMHELKSTAWCVKMADKIVGPFFC